MKKIILLLFISNSVFCQSKHINTNLYAENNEVYWMNIYENKNLLREDLIKHFQKEVLLNMKQDNFQIIDSTISFTVTDDKVDYKKYGGSEMGTAIIIKNYMTYLVIIDFKDYKYKVKVKEILIDNKLYTARIKGDLSEFILKRKSSDFIKSKVLDRGLGFMDKHFIEKFSIKETSQKDW